MLVGLLLSLAISLVLFKIYKFVTANFDYFEKRNIKYITPLESVIGLCRLFFRTATPDDYVKSLYDAFPNEPIIGLYDLHRPQYVVRSPEIIKQIGVRDFDHFEDHRLFTSKITDSMWGNSLFFLKGQEWRQMRATLSPIFTGSKMRQMFELVGETADVVVEHFAKRLENGETIDIEAKELFSQYTNDVITSCAFGIKVNSLATPDNEFYVSSNKIMNFTSIKSMLKTVLVIARPHIAKALNIALLDKSVEKSFKDTILNTMEIRKKKNIHRPDMINLMMQIRQGTLDRQLDDDKNNDGYANIVESDVGRAKVNRVWNDDEIVAQCFLFFLANITTSATMLTATLYELHMNPHVLQKLYDEIDETHSSLDGKRITYEMLKNMKYLDQVVCETLRKWPPNMQLDRSCVKDYVYDDGKLKFKAEKGRIFFFPIFGIQNDPKYFPEPEKYEPERFSDENRDKIVPGSYIPFGIGPRGCIASRFANMQIKTILYYFLLNYSFESNEKTQIPLKFKKTAFSLLPETEFHLTLKLRERP